MWLIENSGLLSQETQTAEARAFSRHGKFLDEKCPTAGWPSEMPCGGKGGKQRAGGAWMEPKKLMNEGGVQKLKFGLICNFVKLNEHEMKSWNQVESTWMNKKASRSKYRIQSKGKQKQMKGAKQAEAGSQKSAVRTNTESIAKCYIQITFIMNCKTLFTTLNLFEVGWMRNKYAYKTISRPYIIWLSN